jgi:hypothetical protein
MVINKGKNSETLAVKDSSKITDQWIVSKVFEIGSGKLKAVAVTENGSVVLGGVSFISCYDPDFKLQWDHKTEKPVTALAAWGNSIYAGTSETILVLDQNGVMHDEWGPFEGNSIITSIAVNEAYIAIADAGNKIITILDKKGVVKSLIGKSGEPFIIPSPYFDISLGSDNTLYAANTGNRRIETRNIDGTLLGYFGEPGTDPGAFCGCCNPAHFTLIPGGFVTAEKGINRIKILNDKGEFVEFVSSVNNFIRPLPLDIASKDGQIIYAANPADSKVYVFKRR